MTFSASVFVCEKLVISASSHGKRFQLFQIIFYKNDGSLFVNFPYHPDGCSYLSKITLHAGLKYPHNVNPKNGGKVTKHKVKFSHHPDGRAHFSQPSKINTSIINNSVDLTDYNGHLFSIIIEGIPNFCEIPQNTQNNNKKKLFFDIEMNEFTNLKFIAYWYCDSYLEKYLKEYHHEGGPQMLFTREGKSDLQGIILENMFIKKREQYYLFLGFENIENFSTDNATSIKFVGGFEPRSISSDHQKDTSFLMLSYPSDKDYTKLIEEIGTVDRDSKLF